jgi:hypothetical protein
MKHGAHWMMVNVPPGYTICGVPVRYDPDSKLVADARGIWPMKWIAVGRQWFTIPFREQEAVLLHEACHALRLHLEVRLLCLPFFWTGWVRQLAHRQELAADRFAVERGSGRDLLRFLARCPGNAGGPFHPSAAERQQHLSRLILEKRHEMAA